MKLSLMGYLAILVSLSVCVVLLFLNRKRQQKTYRAKQEFYEELRRTDELLQHTQELIDRIDRGKWIPQRAVVSRLQSLDYLQDIFFGGAHCL